MKKRRGRRGFWWWSWLLALVTIGGTVGGFYMGKKKWEEAPKEYLATAKVSFNVRDPFVSAKSGVQISTSAVADENEAEVLREAKSDTQLGQVAEELDLAKKWGMSPSDVATKLSYALEFDLDRETDELNVNVILNEPEVAAAVANVVAQGLPSLIQSVDEKNKEEGLKQLEIEAQPYVDQEFEALTKLKKELVSRNIAIEPVEGADFGDALFIREILDAKVEWDEARDLLKGTREGQAEYRNYLEKSMKSSFVTAKAVAPPGFVGPPLEPFQVRWSVYGLTAGMIVGSLLTLLCWKLFP